METMAITAGRRIWISSENRLAMEAFCITIIRMADCAFLDHPDFIALPGSHLMNIYVAVLALNIIDEVGTRIMFCALLLMTSVAGNRFGLDSGALRRVFIDIRDVPVAAITGIGAVDRFGKLGLLDIFMALQAFGIVDTLQTVLPSPDLELLLGQF